MCLIISLFDRKIHFISRMEIYTIALKMATAGTPSTYDMAKL
jgi:hypothetical protein